MNCQQCGKQVGLSSSRRYPKKCFDCKNPKSPDRWRTIKKMVVQLTLEGDIVAGYESIKEAAEKNGILSPSNISRACRNNSSAGDYLWYYLII